MSSPSSLFSETSTTSGNAPNGQDNDGKSSLSEQDERAALAREVHDDLAYNADALNGPLHGALRTPPPIPGLYVFPDLLPIDTAQDALRGIADADHFHGGTRDQVMLFTAPPSASSISKPSTLPPHLDALLSCLSSHLTPQLPPDVHHTVFSQLLARQAILNLYPPGHGITPHIDLPKRYADGILGVSLIGGTVMDLAHPTKGRHRVYLPSRSVYVFVGEARWDWSHGIAGRDRDVVEGVTILRDTRVSLTFRWMKEGGDVLM